MWTYYTLSCARRRIHEDTCRSLDRRTRRYEEQNSKKSVSLTFPIWDSIIKCRLPSRVNRVDSSKTPLGHSLEKETQKTKRTLERNTTGEEN